MKRVILFKNGTDTDGKVFLVTHSMEELLTAASQKFKVNAKRLFTPQGGELDDLKLIRDDDVLYVSAGESFIPLQPCLASKKNDTLLPATSSTATSSKDWVTLNVGGKYFTTSRSTLVSKEPLSMLARMFAEGENGYLMTPSNVDHNGAYLIDRSPTYFEPILNYLRNGQLIFDTNVNPEGVLEEARFFGLESLVPQLEAMITSNQRSRDNLPLSRRDVINALVCTPFTAELRFQGVNLAGSDLSRLDLRYINFKLCMAIRFEYDELLNVFSHQGNITPQYACLHGCRMVGANLSWCCLERADLSHAQLEGAHLLGVKMLCANLEGANLRGCNFEDPAGSRANMEGVNLKGANLEGSNMAGVNLRVATLKNANLQNCDLRAAVLAGADLENCDLSGSDLNEANLRGANLKGAAFELMLTPLHMSQAIR